MNFTEFFTKLEKAFQNFKVHGDVIGEIIDLIGRSGCEKAFVNLLIARLTFLRDNGILATKHQEFEPLEKGVYSMHVDVQRFNMRILYMFEDNQSPVLLHAFYEKAGHKKTDYTGRIPLALSRFAELKEVQ